MDPVTIATFVGGIVGAGLRVMAAPDQETFGRKSVVDIVLGGIIGILVPVTVGLPEGSVAAKGAIVALSSYAGSNLLQDVLARVKK